jgi:hypothetical protein
MPANTTNDPSVTFSIDSGLNTHCAQCGHKTLEPPKYSAEIQVRRPFTPIAFFLGFVAAAAAMAILASVLGIQNDERTPDWMIVVGIVISITLGGITMGLWNAGMPSKAFQVVFCDECQHRNKRLMVRVLLGTLALFILSIPCVAVSQSLNWGIAGDLIFGAPMLLSALFMAFIMWTFMAGDRGWFNRRRTRITVADKTKGLLEARFPRRPL